MKSIKQTFIFALISISFFISIEKSTGQGNKKTIPAEKLNQIVETLMEESHISGLSASIINGNLEIWKGNFGLANRETERAVDDSTIFLLYSVTKTFTGIGLMQLHEQGHFNLDDAINSHLPFDIYHPDYPSTEITFEMLMSHISGIKDNWSVISDLMVYNEDTEIGLSEFLQDYLLPGGAYYGENTSFSNNEPGTSFNYSNVGATLGGYLIETISGQPYHHYIEEHILQPLGMNRSKFYLSDIDTSKLAVEYRLGGEFYIADGFMSNPLIPAGFLHSSRDEMSNYIKMLINRGKHEDSQILDSALFEMMTTELFPAIAPNSGLFFGYDDVNNLWGHTGGYNGVKTLAFFSKEENWGVVILSNGAGEPWNIASALYQYAKEFESLSLSEINFIDANENLVIEKNEIVDFEIIVKNNLLSNLSNVGVEIICSDPDIKLIDSTDLISQIESGEELALPLNFQIETLNYQESKECQFTVFYSINQTIVDSSHFEIYLGEADILLIHDEEHLYKNLANSLQYYKNSLQANSKTYRTFDINLFSLPSSNFLQEFESVIWFTGLDNEEFHSILTDDEQQLIADYLSSEGKLFLSGQNISDAISNTSFFQSYLHSAETTADWSGNLNIQGVDGNEISSGLNFSISGGSGSNTQYSPSSIEPVNEASKIFNYSNTDVGAGIMYDGNYKLVFIPFCFSSIDNENTRNIFLQRILAFFESESKVNEISPFEVKIYPNPSKSETINIQTNNEVIQQLEIYNSRGQLTYNDLENSSKIQLNTIDLNSGIYFVKIFTKNNVFIKRLVKQ